MPSSVCEAVPLQVSYKGVSHEKVCIQKGKNTSDKGNWLLIRLKLKTEWNLVTFYGDFHKILWLPM